MKYQDEFRGRELVAGLAERIRRLAARRARPMTFMEVCGTHTMAIYQYGLRTLLPPEVRLISGPGCPVCVTPNGYLDRALALSRLPDVTIVTFGDMLRVPGSRSSLMEERARGADIRIVYSPLDAVALAGKNPGRRVVFLGVGFETTAPAIAGSILAAKARGLTNYFVLASHKTIPIPMEILSSDPELAIDGYLCPAHVSAIIGADAYRPLAERGIPCVVTGFEPADVMQGVEMLVRQMVEGRHEVENQYRRVVRRGGEPEGAGDHRGALCPGGRGVARHRRHPRQRPGHRPGVPPVRRRGDDPGGGGGTGGASRLPLRRDPQGKALPLRLPPLRRGLHPRVAGGGLHGLFRRDLRRGVPIRSVIGKTVYQTPKLSSELIHLEYAAAFWYKEVVMKGGAHAGNLPFFRYHNHHVL